MFYKVAQGAALHDYPLFQTTLIAAVPGTPLGRSTWCSRQARSPECLQWDGPQCVRVCGCALWPRPSPRALWMHVWQQAARARRSVGGGGPRSCGGSDPPAVVVVRGRAAAGRLPLRGAVLRSPLWGTCLEGGARAHRLGCPGVGVSGDLNLCRQSSGVSNRMPRVAWRLHPPICIVVLELRALRPSARIDCACMPLATQGKKHHSLIYTYPCLHRSHSRTSLLREPRARECAAMTAIDQHRSYLPLPHKSYSLGSRCRARRRGDIGARRAAGAADHRRAARARRGDRGVGAVIAGDRPSAAAAAAAEAGCVDRRFDSAHGALSYRCSSR